jgi:hypothetical protein
MGSLDGLSHLLLVSSEPWATRRRVLLASLLAAVPLAMGGAKAQAGKLDPSETAITLPDAIEWVPWSGLPPHSGEMATLYGGLDKPGP